MRKRGIVMRKRSIELGLVKGRHEMPVQEYIFESDIKNPMDFDVIEGDIHNTLISKFGLTFRESVTNFPNQADYTDIPCMVGNQELVIYVTGLTPVTVALINWCRQHGQELTLMHFNKATGSYVSQRVVL